MNVDNITQSEKTTFVDSFKWRFFSKAIWIVLLAVLLAIAAIAFMGTWEETLPSTYMNNMLSRWLLTSLMMVPMVLLILQGRLPEEHPTKLASQGIGQLPPLAKELEGDA